MNYYQKTSQEALMDLGSSLVDGLSEDEVKQKIQEHGLNQIEAQAKDSVLKLFIEQLKNPIVLLLIAAAIISIITGKLVEPLLIIAIVIFMAVIGVALEKKAGDAVTKLKSLTTLDTNVLRDGKRQSIDATQVVPGDIIILTEGDKVPADARILEQNGLKADEAILTGESLPVSKDTDAIAGDAIIGDQKNMLFSGTYIIEGNCQALVVATGMKTELGKVAGKLAEKTTKLTPLQLQLENLSRIITIGTIGFCSVVTVLSLFRGNSLNEALVQSLSLAVAFIPEGLTAVMTVTLAIGINEMVKKQVIIKRLLAAESLGSINVLATDKTGTITTGKMSLEKVWVYDKEYASSQIKDPIFAKLIEVIKYCNNGKGATEIAMANFLKQADLEFEFTDRLHEHRFSSAAKRMTIIKQIGANRVAYSKGAPEILIPRCTKIIDAQTDKLINISPGLQAELLTKVHNYAADGYRVLCLANREFPHNHTIGDREVDEQELVFLGLVLFIDPLREEVAATVKQFTAAGIRPIMITGDHPEIAKTIALNAGIIQSRNQRVVTGNQLDLFFAGKSDLSAADIVDTTVFARVTPEHKSQLIGLFRDRGLSIAMTGDGINDAVAIAKSDIGIGVVNASDVVKEASDIIVTGNYSALANAVEVGRTIIYRTRLYLNYLLSGNASQVLLFTLALVANLPIPLTAISLLLINVLTDAAPAMSLAFEKGDESLMREKPRTKNQSMLTGYIWTNILVQSIVASTYLFIVFIATLPLGLVIAQTATFTAYIFQKLWRAFTARSFNRSIFSYGIFSNRPTLVAVATSLAVWYLAVYVAGSFFGMQPLAVDLMLPIAAGSLINPAVEEVTKLANRLRKA
jgi:Ca2+-transporting ATPase